MRRVGSNETYVGQIPLQLFRDNKFSQKLYLDEATRIVFEGLENLKVSKAEPINVCSGYLLSKASDGLRSKGFNLSIQRIVGKTQKLAENEFVKSLVKMGVEDEINVSKMRSFKRLLSWVREDLPERERFVKTGWKSWTKYGKVYNDHEN